jgi:ornithine decarboxylase
MWNEKLPGVGIYYSFKTNSDPELIKTMLAMGTNFDCASKGEIKAAIALGVKPENILYANPCKMESHIAYARDVGVKIMTFDCVEEA